MLNFGEKISQGQHLNKKFASEQKYIDKNSISPVAKENYKNTAEFKVF